MRPDERRLDDALLAAHRQGDGRALARLHARFGRAALARGETDRGCFHLTHAYVHALECGLAEAAALRRELKRHGREE